MTVNPNRIRAGKAGRAASPWNKFPHCGTAKAIRAFARGKRLTLIAKLAAKATKEKTVNRPTYEVPPGTPQSLASLLKAAADRKVVWVDSKGEAFWLNDLAQADRLAAKHGGHVFPPVYPGSPTP